MCKFFRNIAFGFLLICAVPSSGQVKISVFNSVPVKLAIIGIQDGNFTFSDADGKIADAAKGDNFYITLYNQKLLLNNSEGIVGLFNALHLKAVSPESLVKIVPVEPKSNGRTYAGDFTFRIEYGRILIINEVDVETYIAGVVEAEAGISAEPEFRKAQALLCRTYLYKNRSRHESEGFNLCDEVHCQAYKGYTPFTPGVYKSTSATANKVVTGSDNNLIAATFHANCGGETESPGNTWLKESEYMVPVKDPYCQQKRNSTWVKEIPLTEWKSYLTSQGVKGAPVSMQKSGRQLYYKVGKDSLSTKKIRDDWSLKSSYFKVIVKKDKVQLNGRGYGHGVGLCQDGANVMAVQGFKCEDIMRFYFRNIRITDYNASIN